MFYFINNSCFPNMCIPYLKRDRAILFPIRRQSGLSGVGSRVECSPHLLELSAQHWSWQGNDKKPILQLGALGHKSQRGRGVRTQRHTHRAKDNNRIPGHLQGLGEELREIYECFRGLPTILSASALLLSFLFLLLSLPLFSSSPPFMVYSPTLSSSLLLPSSLSFFLLLLLLSP